MVISSLSNPAQSAQSQAQNNVPRLVADTHGTILYASAAFQTLAKRDIPIEKGEKLFDLIRFEDMEDAFNNAWMGDDVEAALAGIFDGEHYVSFGDGMRAVPLQFNWIEMADGKRFLIASSIGQAQNAQEQMIPILHGQSLPIAKEVTYYDADDSGLHHFLDLSHEMLCQLSEDGAFSWINDTFCAALKTDNSVLGNKVFTDLVHPDDKETVSHIIHHFAEDDAPQIMNFECRMIASDAEIVFMEWRLKKTDGKIYALGHDLTAIKSHENILHKHQDKLLEAEAIGKMGHWHWRLGQDEFEWSDEIYRIFGQDKTSFVPSLDHLNTFINRRDVSRIMQVFQRAMIENKDYEVDFKVTRPSGALCYVRCQGRCETDYDGDVIGLYGIMQDITQDTLREQDLRDAKEAAESAYAAKSRFLANMSHELRTPLNAIIGFSEMIQNQLLGPIGNDRYLEYIGGIRESGEHLLDLISDILDMSKIEAGKYDLDVEKFSIAKVIRMAVHMMEGRAVDSSIKMIVDIDNEDLQVVADRRAVMQILLNLLSNSVKFSPNGGQIDIRCEQGDPYLKIQVQDNGIGIPSHKLLAIMKPFEQVSSEYTREHEGSGLGLAITKELVEMHGG